MNVKSYLPVAAPLLELGRRAVTYGGSESAQSWIDELSSTDEYGLLLSRSKVGQQLTIVVFNGILRPLGCQAALLGCFVFRGNIAPSLRTQAQARARKGSENAQSNPAHGTTAQLN
jgi:hypothetical protein